MMLRVTGKLGTFSGHPMIDHFKFVKEHTRAAPKMTIPSPSSLHFRYGRDAVPESIYPDMSEFLPRSRRDLPKGRARFCRRRLPISAARRGQLRLSLRPEAAGPGRQPRRRSGHTARDIRRDDQCRDVRYSIRHDHRDAFVPRQFPVDLCRLGRLRAGGGESFQRHQRARLFHGIRQRPRRRFRAAAVRTEGQDSGARPCHVQIRPA